MHSEHLTNLHPGWIVGGWLVAAAITGGGYIVLVGAGMLPGGTEVWGLAVSMAVGFFVGGLFVGLRWTDAPILHGGAITFFSVLIWFLGSVALPGSVAQWSGPTPAVLGLVLLQLVASVSGGWVGRRTMLGGSDA